MRNFFLLPWDLGYIIYIMQIVKLGHTWNCSEMNPTNDNAVDFTVVTNVISQQSSGFNNLLPTDQV